MARVLLVEDEALVALAAKMALEEGGHTVIGPVDRVRDALAVAAAEKIDLALVDVSLAGHRTGIEAARALAAMGIPSIFATSRHGAARRHGGTRKDGGGAVGLLGKPYTAQALNEAVETVLQLIRGVEPRRIPRGLELFRDI